MTSSLGNKKSSGGRNCANFNIHNAYNSTKYTACIYTILTSEAYHAVTICQCIAKRNMDAVVPCIGKLKSCRSRVQPT
jgi:hypothetical protein